MRFAECGSSPLRQIKTAAVNLLIVAMGQSEQNPMPIPREKVPGILGEFSLVLGGPFFQLLRRAHLSDDALMPVRQRMMAFSLFCWLPLLVLSALAGTMLGASVAVPFLSDFEVHIRFLVAMPLLVGAELVVHRRMRFLVTEFLERNLISESAMTQFKAAVASALRLRNSAPAEGLLIAFVYIVGILIIWRHYVALDTATWYATAVTEGSKLSFAGMWYVFASLPIFQFLLCRWYFRIFIWTRFLWQVSRINLSLVPIHPDRVGGLGFLSNTIDAFIPLLLAHGVLLAGLMGERIYHVGARLADFTVEIAVLVALLMCVIFGPLLFFSAQLAEARRNGNREYGALAERYVRAFDTKWLRGGAVAEEQLVGSADVQSLADMCNSFEVVRTMRLAPFTWQAILLLASAIVAPVTPLILTLVPLEDVLKKLVGILI
jgi:hypothetical protein